VLAKPGRSSLLRPGYNQKLFSRAPITSFRLALARIAEVKAIGPRFQKPTV
jgi:hypothetical protein